MNAPLNRDELEALLEGVEDLDESEEMTLFDPQEILMLESLYNQNEELIGLDSIDYQMRQNELARLNLEDEDGYEARIYERAVEAHLGW
jgi:hypothetical protein